MNRYVERPLRLLFCVVLVTFGIPLRAGPLAAGESVGGKTIAEWSVDWWQFILSQPLDSLENVTSEVVGTGNVGGPVFLLNASSGAPLDLDIVVPADQYLLFPLVAVATYDDSPEVLRDDAEGLVATAGDLFATLNGTPIENLLSHRETSGYFVIDIPPDGFDPGTFDAYADGYWLMLEPLGPGVHTLSFGGTLFTSPTESVVLATTYRITSTVEAPATGTLLLGCLALIGLAARARISNMVCTTS